MRTNASGPRPRLADVLRHEVGHAVMAAHLGCALRFIVCGLRHDGWPYGWANYTRPKTAQDQIQILSAGNFALYLKDVAGSPNRQSFGSWFYENQQRSLGAVADWNEILRISGLPIRNELSYYLDRAIMPHFQGTMFLLATLRDEIDRLVDLAEANPPGLGRRALRNFANRKPTTNWEAWLDKFTVIRAARSESSRF